MNFLETVGFDVLIVFVLDRLAGDPYIRQTLEKEFIARNANVEYVLGDYDETPQGEVRKDLDATFAKWENAVRVENFNRGKCRKAENGLFVTGKAPYGYMRDENGLAGLSIDEPQAEVIRWIYDMYVNRGYSIKKIIRELENSNILSHSGQSNWGATSVNRILRNTAYVGKLYYNKGKSRGKKQLERDHDEWIEIPVSPIIEQWLFDAAEKRFKENLEHMRQNPKYSYLLSGRVWCDCCGHCYAGETHKAGVGRRKTTIQTYRHRESIGHCLNREIKAEYLEFAVWEQVVAILKDPKTLRRGYEESLEQQKITHARQQGYLETLYQNKAKFEQAQHNLNAAYIDPDVSLSRKEYIAQKNRIDNELSQVMKEIEETKGI